jgi:hypothetical protein
MLDRILLVILGLLCGFLMLFGEDREKELFTTILIKAFFGGFMLLFFSGAMYY